MKIKKFEDLECWKKSRELTQLVYSKTKRYPFKNDFGLKDQIQRSAISVMSNIVEGFSNLSDREFIKFLGYSIRSACEFQSQCYIALDQKYIDQEEFQKMYLLAEECIKMCKSLVKYLNKSKEKGND
jgi:four helix bundle protein